MSYEDRISIDPAVCHGRACVAGTRVMEKNGDKSNYGVPSQ